MDRDVKFEPQLLFSTAVIEILKKGEVKNWVFFDSWHTSLAMLGPDNPLLRAIKVHSLHPQTENELRNNKNGETIRKRKSQKSLSFLLKWNITDRFKKFPKTLKYESNRCEKLFREAWCEACSSIDLEAIKVHVGHCQNCPVKTFVLFSHHTEETPIDAWHDYLVFFWSEVWSDVHRDAAGKSIYKTHSSVWYWLLKPPLRPSKWASWVRRISSSIDRLQWK